VAVRFINHTNVDLVLRVFDLNRFDDMGDPAVALGPTIFTNSQPITVSGFTADGSKNYQARWIAQSREQQPRQGTGDVSFEASQITQDVDIFDSDLTAAGAQMRRDASAGEAAQKPSATGRIDVPAAAKSKSGKQSMTRDAMAPSGISISVSAPTTYQMQYANGSQTYTETFALVRLDQTYVNALGGAIAAAVNAAAAWLATIPAVGDAVAGFLELAASYYSAESLNPDGSVTVMLADHYCGTKAGGVDLTAWPVPGVNATQWDGVVRGVQSLA
jgi:hypothetical protein